MKIENLKIHNFRSIKEMDMECGKGMNIITGINGAGKTTVLNALEIGLSWLKERIRTRGGKGRYPDVTDITFGEEMTDVRFRVVNGEEVDWNIVKISPRYRGSERPKSDLVKLTSYTDRLVEAYTKGDANLSMPMMVKYTVNRSLIEIPTHVRKKHILDAMSLYEEKMDGGGTLRAFYEWFREREDIEREIHDETKSFDYKDPQLIAVRDAISTVMEGYGELHTRRKAPTGFELRKGNQIMRVSQLSDGEKCYMTLVGDIARRLAICKPKMERPLQGEGIVLIDELELHLHPKWQVEAIDKLRSVFPNCQFFITTHSPHIVQNLRLEDGDTLTVMDAGIPVSVSLEYGIPVDDVLREIFALDSLRPIPVAEKIAAVWNILRDGTFEGRELETAMKALRTVLPHTDMEFGRISLQIALNRKKDLK